MSDTTPPALCGGEEPAASSTDNDGRATERDHNSDVDEDEPNH